MGWVSEGIKRVERGGGRDRWQRQSQRNKPVSVRGETIRNGNQLRPKFNPTLSKLIGPVYMYKNVLHGKQEESKRSLSELV